MDAATRNSRKNYGELKPKPKIKLVGTKISEENKNTTSNITTAETVKDIQKHAHQFDISGQTSGKETWNPFKSWGKSKGQAQKNEAEANKKSGSTFRAPNI